MRGRYCVELESWISKGWLKRWDGPDKGVIPLLAVFQPTKDKVRPVMDYRELNNFVECHTSLLFDNRQTLICYLITEESNILFEAILPLF